MGGNGTGKLFPVHYKIPSGVCTPLRKSFGARKARIGSKEEKI